MRWCGEWEFFYAILLWVLWTRCRRGCARDHKRLWGMAAQLFFFRRVRVGSQRLCAVIEGNKSVCECSIVGVLNHSTLGVGELTKFANLVDLAPLFDRRGNIDLVKCLGINFGRVQVEYHEVGKLAKFDGSFAVLFEKLLSWPDRLCFQCSHRVDALLRPEHQLEFWVVSNSIDKTPRANAKTDVLAVNLAQFKTSPLSRKDEAGSKILCGGGSVEHQYCIV